MQHKLLYYIIFLLVVFSSCRKEAANRKRVKANTLQIDTLDFKYLSAKGKAVYSKGGKSTKVTMDIRLIKDSAVWCSLRMMGVEGLRVLAKEDSIFMINRLAKEYYPMSYKDLEVYSGIPLNYDILQGLIIGEIPSSYTLNNKALMGDDYFILRNYKGDFKVRAYIGRTIPKLQKIFMEKKKATNDYGLEIVYKNFKPLSEDEPQLFPFLCTVQVGEEKAEVIEKPMLKLNFDYSRVRLEEDPIKLSFSISSKYKTVDAKTLSTRFK